MSGASTSGSMSPQLLEVVERARREPEGRFHALAHRIDVPALERVLERRDPNRPRLAPFLRNVDTPNLAGESARRAGRG